MIVRHTLVVSRFLFGGIARCGLTCKSSFVFHQAMIVALFKTGSLMSHGVGHLVGIGTGFLRALGTVSKETGVLFFSQFLTASGRIHVFDADHLAGVLVVCQNHFRGRGLGSCDVFRTLLGLGRRA